MNCSKCGGDGPFFRGRSRWCKECHKAYQRKRLADPVARAQHTKRAKAWALANPERVRELSLHHRSKIPPEKRLWTGAYHGAISRNLEFTITVADIHIPEYCPCLGIRLVTHIAGEPRAANSPSIDRIDSSKGYTPDNVWVISRRANWIKNNATPDELFRIAAALVKRAA